MTTPWLSVLMPTYNGSQYIEHALDSIVSQKDKNIEVILVDDGSTDDTVEKARAFSNRLDLHIIESERVKNWILGTNRALSASSGRFACILHQDDFWMASRISRVKQTIEQNPECTLILHDSYFADSKGSFKGKWRCPFGNSPRHIEREELLKRLYIQNFIAMPSPIFSRSLAVEIGGLHKELWYTADWDFWFRLSQTTTATYLPEALTAFRIHPASLTVTGSSKPDIMRNQMQTVADRIEHEAQAKGLKLPDHIRKAASFSILINHSLAAIANKQNVDYKQILSEFIGLGARGHYEYWKNSRIHERVTSRLRANLLAMIAKGS